MILDLLRLAAMLAVLVAMVGLLVWLVLSAPLQVALLGVVALIGAILVGE